MKTTPNKKKRKKPLKMAAASADWKDIQGLAESFEEALKEFGLVVTPDPLHEGSDQYGYIISKRPLNARDLKRWRKMNGFED